MNQKQALVWAKTNGKCWYCGTELDENMGVVNPNSFAIDHQHPQRQGGSKEIDNLVPACWTCNSRKHNRTVNQFRLYLSFKKAGIDPLSPDQSAFFDECGIEIPLPEPIVFYGEADHE